MVTLKDLGKEAYYKFEKGHMSVNCIFSFSQNVFYPIKNAPF